MNDIGAPQGPTPYDISGNEIPRLKAALATQQQTKRGFVRRTPPENIDNYQDYTIFLSFLPLDDECHVDDEDVCRSAWDKLVKSNCEHSQSSILGDQGSTDKESHVRWIKSWLGRRPHVQKGVY